MGNKSNSTRITYSSAGQFGSNPVNSFEINLDLPSFRNGTDLPDYQKIIQLGGDATTPLNAEACTFKYKLPRFDCFYGSNPCWDTDVGLRSSVHLAPSFLDGLDPDLTIETQAKCRSYAYQKLQTIQRKGFQEQAFAGEFKETLQFLRSPFKAIDSLMTRSLRNSLKIRPTRKFQNAQYKRDVKDMADIWLELRFGLIPLVSDIKNIAFILNDLQTREEHTSFRFYAKAETSTTDSWQFQGGFINGFGNIFYYRSSETFIRYGLRAAMIDKINHLSDVQTVFDTANTLAEIPSALYELTPYSWLADYFWNVGNILNAASVSTTVLSYVSESTVRTRRVTQTVEGPLLFGDPAFSSVSFAPGQSESTRRLVDRTTGTLAIPPLYFSLPGGNIQFANITALLASKI